MIPDLRVPLLETQASVVSTLQDLIRINTTNPPGNEIQCANYIQHRLLEVGISSTVLEASPSRGSVIARIHGNGELRPLLLLSHIDVVRAEEEKWKHPPFSGELIDGEIWGRGAIDMKGLTAIELELFLLIKRLGLPLKRDVILAATADEEAGGYQGVKWLVENHFDLLDAEYAINEGGGLGRLMGNRWVFDCMTGSKGICWLRLRTHGEPGHASTPWGDLAINQLARIIDRLIKTSRPQHQLATVVKYIQTMSNLVPVEKKNALLALLNPDLEAEGLAQIPDQLAAELYASLHNTVTPTILRAGEKINVIPSTAEAQLDCRLLPGQRPEDVIAEIKTALVNEEVEIELIRWSPGHESSFDSPLYNTICNVMEEIVPDSLVVPSLATGAEDGRFLAEKGIKVFGLWPMKMSSEQSLFKLIHAHDERISVENLSFATQVLWEVISRTIT